jgi:hypothetical protein
MPSRPLPIPSNFNPPSVIVTPKVAATERKTESPAANTQLPLHMAHEPKPIASPEPQQSSTTTTPSSPAPAVSSAPARTEVHAAPAVQQTPQPKAAVPAEESQRPPVIHTHPSEANAAPKPSSPASPSSTAPDRQQAGPRNSEDGTSMS